MRGCAQGVEKRYEYRVLYLLLGATVVRTSDPCPQSVKVGVPNASEGPRLHQPSEAEATSPFCLSAPSTGTEVYLYGASKIQALPGWWHLSNVEITSGACPRRGVSDE